MGAKAEKKRVKEEAKKAEEEKKKAAEAAAAAAEKPVDGDKPAGEEKKEGEEKNEGDEKKEGADGERKDEEMKEETKEEKKDEEKKEEADEEDEAESEPEEEEKEEPLDETPPKVELTAEEKKILYFKGQCPDMTGYLLSTSFAMFSLPEKDEGFDDITYSWAKGTKAQEYIKKWILERKLSTKVEDLVPSKWFWDEKSRYEGELAKFHAKLAEWRTATIKKEQDKAAKAAAKVAAEKAKVEAAEALA